MDAALPRVRDAVGDWSGGTRIGDALHAFNVAVGPPRAARGPVVLLISRRLGSRRSGAARRAKWRGFSAASFRSIWLNPLLGSPGYEPLTRGMQAALPFVDDFLPVHNMASLEALAMHAEHAVADARAIGRRFQWN